MINVIYYIFFLISIFAIIYIVSSSLRLKARKQIRDLVVEDLSDKAMLDNYIFLFLMIIFFLSMLPLVEEKITDSYFFYATYLFVIISAITLIKKSKEIK